MRQLALVLFLGLALGACHDTRRDAVRDHLRQHPPEGYTVVDVPETVSFVLAQKDSSEAVVAMKYRLTASTIEMHDLHSLPRAVEVDRRISDIRGWAISSLPAGDALQARITSLVADAQKPFPTKRVVTPAGTEVEASVSVALRKDGAKWVASGQPEISVKGEPDTHNDVPWEDAAAVSNKLAELEGTARNLEEMKRQYLAGRQLIWGRSLARLKAILKTGHVFEGILPDGARVRLVISQGLEKDSDIVGVLTVLRETQSAARYQGVVAPLSSGEAAWRATQMRPLTEASVDLVTDVKARPTLLLAAREKGLAAAVVPQSGPPIPFVLRSVGEADLIPDTSTQDVKNQ